MTVNQCTTDPPSLKLSIRFESHFIVEKFSKVRTSNSKLSKVETDFHYENVCFEPCAVPQLGTPLAHKDHNGTTKHTLATFIPKCGSNNVVTSPLHFRRRRQAAAIATTNEKICIHRQMPLTSNTYIATRFAIASHSQNDPYRLPALPSSRIH